MPSRPPTVSRRGMLVGIAVLAAAGATSAACGSPLPARISTISTTDAGPAARRRLAG
ncbi:hypothetical protein H7H73_29045, partial [Mycobacterium rufum]|nr:hypothetical protein [Mycolicibacterium rufum]